MTYVIITPVKNEAENLSRLIHSIKMQSVKPFLWVIIDDGSTDKSPKLIKDAEREYPWVYSIRLLSGARDRNIHYAEVCNVGFEFILNNLSSKNIRINYIGLLDADIIPENDFFKKLINEFEKDQNLGIASGGIYIENKKGKTVWEKGYIDRPRGGARLWRFKCFEETMPYEIVYTPDVISNIRALMQGWKIRQFKDIKAVQTRETGGAEGRVKGYFENGYGAYYLNYSPILVILKTLKYLLQPRFYLSFAYLSGYLGGFIHKKPRIENEETKSYFRRQRLKELTKYLNKRW